MNASARWEEVIADNLASNQIPGFKKQDLSFHDVQAGFMARTTGTQGATKRSAMPMAGTSINFENGELSPTGSPTDLAIDGAGFFQVQLPDGRYAYTRNGIFQVNAQGELVTKHGFPVVGDAGPLQVDPNNKGPITVTKSGTVTQDGITRGHIKLAAFSDPSVLTPAKTGLYILNDPNIEPEVPAKTSIFQGYLEAGNSSPVSEMGNLITSMRYFEANQKVIQAEDDRMNRLITDVANPSGGS
jgi:flagellar basal body rod protein FlgG